MDPRPTRKLQSNLFRPGPTVGRHGPTRGRLRVPKQASAGIFGFSNNLRLPNPAIFMDARSYALSVSIEEFFKCVSPASPDADRIPTRAPKITEAGLDSREAVNHRGEDTELHSGKTDRGTCARSKGSLPRFTSMLVCNFGREANGFTGRKLAYFGFSPTSKLVNQRLLALGLCNVYPLIETPPTRSIDLSSKKRFY